MSKVYYTPSSVTLDHIAADHAGRVLLALAETDLNPITAKQLQDAGNALVALGNDTDAIVTDPEVLS